MRLLEARDGWLLDVQARRRTPRTLEWYRVTITPFLQYCSEAGAETIEGLTAGHLRGYIVTALAHLAPDTQHNRVACIKNFSHWLYEQELLPRDPFERVKRPAIAAERRSRALTPRQVADILARYDTKDPFERRDLVILRLVLDTGLRRGEVCSARLEDFDQASQSLWVLGKGRKRRRVPLSAETVNAVWKYLHRDRAKLAVPGSEWLFLSRSGGQVSGNHLGHTFHQKAAAAGIQARFHDLRHTAATWTLRAGMPKERVSRLLGHANDSITSLYEHLEFEDIQAAHSQAAHLRPLGFGRQL
ncbi:MAG: tyrosine-type recombinase/integrase [Chloroflexi bacterium]|nr:tyrosine-type recombinase/integrase [Chloroflexota bacterium]